VGFPQSRRLKWCRIRVGLMGTWLLINKSPHRARFAMTAENACGRVPRGGLVADRRVSSICVVV
jgi:hypothetical protein